MKVQNRWFLYFCAYLADTELWMISVLLFTLHCVVSQWLMFCTKNGNSLNHISVSSSDHCFRAHRQALSIQKPFILMMASALISTGQIEPSLWFYYFIIVCLISYSLRGAISNPLWMLLKPATWHSIVFHDQFYLLPPIFWVSAYRLPSSTCTYESTTWASLPLAFIFLWFFHYATKMIKKSYHLVS